MRTNPRGVCRVQDATIGRCVVPGVVPGAVTRWRSTASQIDGHTDWLVDGRFTSWQHVRTSQDVIVRTHGDFIVLPQWETKPLAHDPIFNIVTLS